MSDLAVNWEGEYALYEHPEDWLPELKKRQVSSWILGQMIFASHNEGRFRTRTAEKTVMAGSVVRLDAWDLKKNVARMKSFEKGDTMSDPEVSDSLTGWESSD